MKPGIRFREHAHGYPRIYADYIAVFMARDRKPSILARLLQWLRGPEGWVSSAYLDLHAKPTDLTWR